MAGFVQAVALDLDGTLTRDGVLSQDVLTAIDECRDTGVSVVLNTGRIRSELEREFPELVDHVDALVYENGAVLQIAGQLRLCAPPVDPLLVAELSARGMEFRRGEVILACRGSDAPRITVEIARLGLDLQVVRNRTEAMVLPAGVSKGTGLRAALEHLAVSPHNAVAIGDAENDLSMLDAAEIGVAVANAIDSVRRHADLLLEVENGHGVAELLRGPLISGALVVKPQRHSVRIGQTPDGHPVTVPGSRASILLSGGSGTGKSHLTGLLVERWIESGYTVLVIDPEGDHAALSRLPGTTVIDAVASQSDELAQTLRQPYGSVVLDLSHLDPDQARHYLDEVASAVETLRSLSGRPHWVVIEEAHGLLREGSPISDIFRPYEGGYCYVTYQPEGVFPTALASIDLTLTPLARDPSAAGVHARALYRPSEGGEVTFEVDGRITPHVRHRHKYAQTPLPARHRFAFRDQFGHVICSPSTLEEFEQQLRLVPAATVQHHALNGDFSRWTFNILADRELGALLFGAENELTARHAQDLDHFRQRLLTEVRQRYLGEEHPEPEARPPT